ncbi:flagellar biosynthetic protein FliO [Butyrivibrio sp. VCB2006]|uniref:flagellar biosynthetic protein FliO n=1 Tax=Butyrivibrio sp. VCB2006 TaxID=1280679 RepID=UPI000406FB89|nr:flagellar biosynthetic protein FliO [Butyrivibrio sp. VCB2006]
MGLDSYLQFISVLIIFVLVLGITLYVTKWMANYQKGSASSKNIEIIDTCKIATNKYIQIIRIGEKYISIAVSGDQVTNLGEVNPDELVPETQSGENLGFKEIFDKIKGEKKGNGK